MCTLRHALQTAILVESVVGVRVGEDSEVFSNLTSTVDRDVDLELKPAHERAPAAPELLQHDDDYYEIDHEHGHDHDDVKTIAFACHSGLNNWEKEWSEQKKTYCCETEKLGCKAEHFDCMEGLDKWMSDWSGLKIDWCCHNKNIACVKCEDYKCPADHHKISQATGGSIKCKHSPCKNSECCELWGNMELVRKPTPAPTHPPETPRPTPMPTLPHLDDPFDCGTAIVDANTGWSFSKKEWCCTNKNIGCKQLDEPDAGHGRIGWGADGRRRASFSDGRRRWSSQHDHNNEQECHDYYYYYHLFPDDDLLQEAVEDNEETADETAEHEGEEEVEDDDELLEVTDDDVDGTLQAEPAAASEVPPLEVAAK